MRLRNGSSNIRAIKVWIIGRVLLLSGALMLPGLLAAQVTVYGTIYDQTYTQGLDAVSVFSTSGKKVISDSLGKYRIEVAKEDSLYFSYVGRVTQKFAVSDIPEDQPFDMSLQASFHELPAIRVWAGSYRLDSLNNRKEYQKAFDYSPDYLGTPNSGFGLGISISALFSGKKIRAMESLQKRLLWMEKEKYIDHRFTKAIVGKVTGFSGPVLDSFMIRYRPDYETLKRFENDYTYYEDIKYRSEVFLRTRKEEGEAVK